MTKEEAIDHLLCIADTGMGADRDLWTKELHNIVDAYWPELLGFSDDRQTWFTPLEAAYRMMEAQ
jgi:hypothetical protein